MADLSHEALGHGLVAHFEHAKLIVLSYTYLTSDVQSRLLSSAGPLVNCIEGLLAFALLRRTRTSATVSFFFFLLMVYNVLDAAAYLIYSGVLNSGDLAVVIAGLPPRPHPHPHGARWWCLLCRAYSRRRTSIAAVRA